MQEVAALEEIIITLELCSLPFFSFFFSCVCAISLDIIH